LNWNEVTALFGGTFDPPHLGHREAIRGLFANPGIKRVLILPSALPPHKKLTASTEDRIEMTRLAFASEFQNPFPLEVSVDTREITRAERTGRPSYTIETLQDLRREISNLAFVIGADQLRDLPKWHRFPEVLQLSHWIVLERKPQGEAMIKKTLQEWQGSGLIRADRENGSWQICSGNTVLKSIPTLAPALSSTEIREVIGKTGSPPPGTLPPAVLSYLKKRRVYGTGVDRKGEV